MCYDDQADIYEPFPLNDDSVDNGEWDNWEPMDNSVAFDDVEDDYDHDSIDDSDLYYDDEDDGRYDDDPSPYSGT